MCVSPKHYLFSGQDLIAAPGLLPECDRSHKASSEQLQQWRSRLLTAFGTNGQLIIDVIPEIELTELISSQDLLASGFKSPTKFSCFVVYN